MCDMQLLLAASAPRYVHAMCCSQGSPDRGPLPARQGAQTHAMKTHKGETYLSEFSVSSLDFFVAPASQAVAWTGDATCTAKAA